MPAAPSISEASEDVTQPIPHRKKSRARGELSSMTRHKVALARLAEWPVPACMRFVMHALLCSADAEGITWIQVPTLQAHLPRSARRTAYDRRTVKIALDGWRKLGCLSWTRVPPFGHLPTRNKAGQVVWGKGRFVAAGGRVFALNLAALRGEGVPLSDVGTGLARGDLQIPSGRDLQIPPSDPLASLREAKLDPAPPQGERRAAAAPPKDDGETPRAPLHAPTATRPPTAPIARPSAAHAASESPGAATAARAARPGVAPHRDEKNAGKGREGPQDERGASLDGRARVEAMAAELARALASPRPPRRL